MSASARWTRDGIHVGCAADASISGLPPSAGLVRGPAEPSHTSHGCHPLTDRRGTGTRRLGTPCHLLQVDAVSTTCDAQDLCSLRHRLRRGAVSVTLVDDASELQQFARASARTTHADSCVVCSYGGSEPLSSRGVFRRLNEREKSSVERLVIVHCAYLVDPLTLHSRPRTSPSTRRSSGATFV